MTINKAVQLYPQTRAIFMHLEKRGSISPMEALMTYGCTRLAARIHELRRAGLKISTKMRKDEGGHTYARYTLANPLKTKKAA